ncbi:Glutathione S-transferase (GstA) (PDB:1A0F) [Commensalibacter communis]|uniref:Glutathione S-transferase (GstA) n=1 Tax=Commensalibacter communis TaxID=2972786 RepID=A0A9W4TMT2_9PROT|nr:glutathione S-transferase family protein [Commensalibacter communis]CAI3930081.1 Glutathione S-transferase (GstA) (PDB:1A0F) [Commensalibacter communis]CAI3930667.1 Glutathione S-transferase (GstA) (PDB:1A0F) [Commensalibacter communis]CAI3930825.1 Glutathione S-transferase (GstA) (PDB:1A0F) [Commensalibacter communis]CAI3932361.1 Glutathione S-transferase (GstA) (PDB:1A0F) [Commensalibacter communis]
MKLIGMLDSPYVRRVAISLKAMELLFEHQQLSVFSDTEKMKAVNPLMKAPSLITDEGTLLIDSTLILEYLDRKCSADCSLFPKDLEQFTKSQYLIGIALTLCDKAVQLFMEYNRRPPEKFYQEWADRIDEQLHIGLKLLDQQVTFNNMGYLVDTRIMLADITIAVAIKYIKKKLPDLYQEHVSEKLKQFSSEMEATSLFREFNF